MRVIPKNTKISETIWKGFTFFDLFIAFLLFGGFALMFMSNIQNKFYWVVAYLSSSIFMFLEMDEIRMYRQGLQILKYAVSQKVFGGTERKHERSIDKLVPYCGFLDDGTINYGDYYAKVISIGSIEFRLLNDWMQNHKISVLGKIFNLLGVNQSLQLVKIDRPINFDEISERLFKKITAAEARGDSNHKTQILKGRLSQIDSVNNIKKQYRPYFYLVIYDGDKNDLAKTVETAKALLDGAGLSASILDTKDTVLFLKYCYTRHFDERELDKVSPDKYLDYIKPKSLRFTSRGYQIDDVSAFSFAICDYPLEVRNAWGADLFNEDNTKVVLNIKPIDKSKSIKRVDKVVTELGTRNNLSRASQFLSQETHLETMGSLLQSLQNENELMFDVTLTVTGFNNAREDQAAFRRRLRQNINSQGFRVNSLQCRQLEAFVSSNISRYSNLSLFERGINTMSLSAVFPFVFTSIIEKDGITLGHNEYPVVLDIFKRDKKKYVNSNAIIIGKPGGGKSYFTKTLITNLYSDGCRIFVLDPENEYDLLSKNLNGSYVDVGNASTGKLNPFHIYQILTEDGEPALPETVYYDHLRFLESFFQVTLPLISSDTLELLNNMVVKCYEKRKIFPETDCSMLPPNAFPTFDDLMVLINDALAKEGNAMLKANYQRAQSYMQKFATGGRNSNLWNGPATLTSKEDLTIFNFQSLLAGKNNIVANGQMLLIMKYLEQQVINLREYNKSHPDSIIRPIIVLDEAYNFVDPKYPVALDFVYSWEKRIRKYWGSMIFITQNLKDLSGNTEVLHKTTAIINCSQYSFIFSLAPADVQELVNLYRGAGEINETEQNEISNSDQGHVFLISSPSERTSFNVVASEVVEDLFSKSKMN